MEPPPPVTIRRTASARPSIGPTCRTRRPSSMCAGVVWWANATRSIPALLTQARNGPTACAASAARR